MVYCLFSVDMFSYQMKEGIEIVILVHSVHSRFRANDIVIPNDPSHHAAYEKGATDWENPERKAMR